MEPKLVIVDIRTSGERLANPETFCSEGRLLRCSGIKNETMRLQSLAAELALSYALSGDLLFPPVYRYLENGKPVIDGGYISLSHSGSFAVCALADDPVGVDLEVYRRVSPSIKKRLLSEAELSEYGSSEDENYLLSKFVMKEAYLKLTGEGIAGGLSSVEEDSDTVFFRGEPVGSLFRLVTYEFILAAVTKEKTAFNVIRL